MQGNSKRVESIQADQTTQTTFEGQAARRAGQGEDAEGNRCEQVIEI